MNNRGNSRKKESSFCTTRRFLLISVACLAVVPLLYSRTEFTTLDDNTILPPVIPLASTVPVVPDPIIQNQDVFSKAPQTRTLKGVDDTTGEVRDPSFLADVLPLKVLRILPSTQSVYSVSDSVTLSDRTALVVVFNRAVIPLGGDWEQYSDDLSKAPFVLEGLSAVPGKFRWVTTSVARFDPDVNWPTDLQFTLKIKQDLTSYDGTPLTIGEHTQLEQKYNTANLHMTISHVDSPKTRNLTDGLWAAQIHSELPEVPPDAKITLHFTHPIDHDMVSHALLISNNHSNTIQFTSEKCGDQCMHLTLQSALDVDKEYSITLPENSRYHQYAGTLKSETASGFVGLRSFKLAFTQIHQPTWNRYHMWLRHGLDPSVTMEQFQAAMTLTENDQIMSGWSLDRPHTAVIRITGNFKPSSTYTLSVRADANIADGYGLTLQPSTTTFTTGPLPQFVIEPEGSLFEQDFSSDWEVLVRGKQECSGMIVENINKKNVLDVLKSVFNYNKQASTYTTDSKFREFPNKNFNYSVISNSNKKIFGNSGSAIARTICQWPRETIVTKTDYAVAFTDHPDRLTAWVTSMSTGLPVSGATVDIYSFIPNYSSQKADSKLMASGQTDDSGVATLSRCDDYSRAAVITVGDSLLIFRDVPRVYSQPLSATYQAAMFSDRSIYRLGETVYLKGYVNRYDMEALAPVADSTMKMATVFVSWDQQSQVSVTVELDPEVGSFNTNLEVPYTANYGPLVIQVQVNSDARSEAWASVPITIADPRLPTSTLDLTIEQSTYKPQLNAIPVVIETKSYTGNPIPDAEVTLRWSLNRQYQIQSHSRWEWWSWVRPFWTNFESQEIFGIGLMPTGSTAVVDEEDSASQKDQGTVIIKTDATGKAEHMFSLPEELLSRPVTDEDTIQFDVEWIGPTREKLTQTISKRIAHSDWKLGIQLPTEKIIPGYEFDVFSRLLDTSNGDEIIEGQTVELTLYEWDGKTPLTRNTDNGAVSLPAEFAKVSDCKFASSSDRLSHCSFTLPAPRQYLLLAATTDSSSYTVVTAVPLGYSPEDWKRNPLDHLPTSQMIWTDKEQYENGETATVNFYAPYHGRALVFWGSRLASNSLQVQVQAGRTSVEIPIGAECFPDGCTVDIIISVPRNPNNTLPVQVPTSPLLDIGLPKQVHLRTELKVTERLPKVLIDIKPHTEVVRPGATTQIDVSLTTEDNQAVSGELTLWLLDKSIYDLQPSPPPNCTELFRKSFRDVFRMVTSSTQNLRSEIALKNAREIIMRRLDHDHWTVSSWDLLSPSDLDLSDEDFYVKHFGQLTVFPGSFFHHMFAGGREMEGGMMAKSVRFMSAASDNEMLLADAMVLAPMSASADQSSAGQPGPVIRSSNKFVMTPVFLASVKVDSTGKVTLPINLPDNIGTFKVFATAVAVNKTDKQGKLLYGVGESSLVSRHPLSIQPSVPRIARLGDKFQAGVTVTMTEPESDTTQVQVTASINQEATSIQLADVSTTKIVSVKGTQPVEVLFEFDAVTLGDAVVTFTAQVPSTSGTFSDGLEVTIPVLGLQEPVHVATSFSLDARPATVASSEEGIKLPQAVPGSGNVTLEVGVGRLPAILMLSEGIFRVVKDYETGSTLLSALAPKAALEAYAEGLGQTARDNLGQEHERALAKIASYTSESYGLTDVIPDKIYRPLGPTVWLNGMALLQAKLMQKVSDVEISDELTSMWARAFQTALASDINEGHTNMFWISVFHYVFGPNSKLPGVAQQATFDNLVASLDTYSCGVACKAITALTIMDNTMTAYQKTLNNIIAYLESSIRVQGRTAYVTYNLQRGSAHSASNFDNAVALWALSAYNYQTQASLNVLIEKVANYLGANAAASGCYATDSAFVALSLCSYDMMKGSTNPNVKLSVQSGSAILLSELFDSPSDPVVRKQHSWEVLSNTINFDAIGQGEVSVALGLSFIPSELFNTSIYRGIYVEKTIQLIDPFSHEPIGDSLTQIPTGKTVKVTIQVTTRDDLGTVVLIDPVPAGLEPIDPNIAPSAGMTYQFGGFSSYGYFDTWWWPWYSFPNQYTMKDQVKFISPSLSAGTHTVSYEALAVTSGSFTVPPSKAFVLNQPEVMGLSAAGSLVVEDRL